MGNLLKSLISAFKKGKPGWAWIGTGQGLAKLILSKPGARSNLEFLISKVLSGNEEPGQYPEDTIRTADAIADLIRTKGLSPNRIAVDGIPGSGKSSLAKTLGDRLKMTVECLDYKKIDKPVSFSKNQTIFEHHRLFRTQELDHFQIIIYIDEPVEIAKDRILKRKRDAFMIDILNFDKLKRIGDKAFSLTDGKAISIPDSYVKIKIRPETGFRDRGNLDAELATKGITRKESLTKEEALFLCVDEKPKSGFSAYLTTRAYEKDVIRALHKGIFPQRRRDAEGDRG